jgi:hypothetical protein
MKKTRRGRLRTKTLNNIILLSAWSFTLVISSFLFLFVGRWITVRFNTAPSSSSWVCSCWGSGCASRECTRTTQGTDELNNQIQDQH